MHRRNAWLIIVVVALAVSQSLGGWGMTCPRVCSTAGPAAAQVAAPCCCCGQGSCPMQALQCPMQKAPPASASLTATQSGTALVAVPAPRGASAPADYVRGLPSGPAHDNWTAPAAQPDASRAPPTE